MIDAFRTRRSTFEKEKQLSVTQKLLNEKLLEITRSENEEKNRTEKMRFLVDKQTQLQQQNEQDEKQLIEASQSISQLNEEQQREEQQLTQMEAEISKFRIDAEESRKQHESSLQKSISLSASGRAVGGPFF